MIENSSILLLAAVVCGLVAIHPFTTFPLSLALIRRLYGKAESPPVSKTDHSNPSFGICVCAYNEEGSIRAKLKNLQELTESYAGEVKVYIYNDCSADNTLAVLQEYGDQFTIVDGESRGGKSTGMNALMSRCEEDFVVFSDANVRIDTNALDVFASYFESPKIGCICGTLIYEDVNDEVAAQTSSLYWRLEETIKQLESDTGSAMGADGALFAIRRKLFREVPVDIIDDMFTSMSILCDGFEIKRASEAMAFERAAQKSSEEFRRKKRIACRSLNCFRLLRPRLRKLSLCNRYKFLSHKLIRWTTIGWIAASVSLFACYLAIRFNLATAAITIVAGSVLFGLGMFLRLPGISQIGEIMSSFIAAGIGVVQSLFGLRYQTWQPATSAHILTEKTAS